MHSIKSATLRILEPNESFLLIDDDACIAAKVEWTGANEKKGRYINEWVVGTIQPLDDEGDPKVFDSDKELVDVEVEIENFLEKTEDKVNAFVEFSGAKNGDTREIVPSDDYGDDDDVPMDLEDRLGAALEEGVDGVTEAGHKSFSEIFGAERKGMHHFGNSFFTPPYSAKGKKRSFKGAARRGYGPANAPKVVDTDVTGTNSGMMSTLGYGTANDPVSYGGAGDAAGPAAPAAPAGPGALGESATELLSFVRSFADSDPGLVESIEAGFVAIFEGKTEDAVQRLRDWLAQNDVLGYQKDADELPDDYVFDPKNVSYDDPDAFTNEQVEDDIDGILAGESDQLPGDEFGEEFDDSTDAYAPMPDELEFE